MELEFSAVPLNLLFIDLERAYDIIIIIIIIINYAAYEQVHWLMEDKFYFFPYVRLINCRFHLFLDLQLPPLTLSYVSEIIKKLCSFSSSSSYSSSYSISVIYSSMAAWRRQFFLEHDQSNLLFYAGYYLNSRENFEPGPGFEPPDL